MLTSPKFMKMGEGEKALKLEMVGYFLSKTLFNKLFVIG